MTVEKIKILELPAKNHCQLSPFGSFLREIGLIGTAVYLVAQKRPPGFGFFQLPCQTFILYEIHCYLSWHNNSFLGSVFSKIIGIEEVQHLKVVCNKFFWMLKLIQNTVFWDCFSFTKVAFTMVKVVCYFEFYTSLKFFSEYFAIFQNVTISNNLPNSLNTKHLFQKLYCINPSNLDWSCSSLQRIYFISLDQKKLLHAIWL